MVKKKKILFVALAIVILAVAGFFAYSFFSGNNNSFTKTSLIKLNIPTGGSFESVVKISNSEKVSQNFKVYFNDFSDLASLSESEFSLKPQEQKEIQILFQDEKKISEVYISKLIIEGEFSKEEIPVVLGVEDPNRAFAIIQNSIPKYDEVSPGGKMGVEIKVYDLINANVQTVSAEYEIMNFEGDVLKIGESNLVVGSGSKTELFDIPMDWDKGDYVLTVLIDYKGTISFSSYIFSVSKKADNTLSDGFILFAVIMFVFVLGILILIFYFIRTRDSLLIQLRNQQSQELKRNVRYIDKSKEDVSKSKEHPEKKKKKIRELARIKKRVIKQIKHRQKAQKKEVSKLHKHKKKNEIKGKLKRWKDQGYKMYDAEKEVKKITKKGIKDQIKDWNTKGYDTSFLNK